MKKEIKSLQASTYFNIYSAEAQEKLQTILDQKNYLEELNRHLK